MEEVSRKIRLFSFMGPVHASGYLPLTMVKYNGKYPEGTKINALKERKMR